MKYVLNNPVKIMLVALLINVIFFGINFIKIYVPLKINFIVSLVMLSVYIGCFIVFIWTKINSWKYFEAYNKVVSLLQFFFFMYLLLINIGFVYGYLPSIIE